MVKKSDLRHRAFTAHLAQNLAGPTKAILDYQELVAEQARELGLDRLLPDLEKVSGAAAELNRLLDQLIESGFEQARALDATLEATLRHDLRTPLNAIIGFSEMVAEELADLQHEALRRDVAVVLAEAGALLDRIDLIVDFSRSQESQASLLAAYQAHRVADQIEAVVDSDAACRDAGSGRILVIDDVASNRDLLARRLGRDGHEVILAESGRQALEQLNERDFDLILLDILMPDMNGIELLSSLKAHEALRRIPVIMISGLKEIGAVIRCIEAGADDYLPKPFNPVLLRARIGACLEKKRWADLEQHYLRRIEFEKDRADALLHAILPGQIVARLSDGEQVIADWFDSATILFADLVGFTAVAAQISPDRLVRRLDAIVRAFDGLCEEHGVEKIKTIGDAYMAAAGVPEPIPDHAERVVRLASAMHATLARVDSEVNAEEVPFRIRIGIHTGPVVAGLIGHHRFVYDIWGETVNIASRLETHCIPGRIQISEATRSALGSGWSVEPRGSLNLKGVGNMEAFFVEVEPVAQDDNA